MYSETFDGFGAPHMTVVIDLRLSGSSGVSVGRASRPPCDEPRIDKLSVGGW